MTKANFKKSKTTELLANHTLEEKSIMKLRYRLWLGLFASIFVMTGLLLAAPSVLAQQNYWDVNIMNKCSYPIWVAVSYNDKESSQWVDKGWWKLAPGETKYPFDTRNKHIYFYAETAESVNGQGKLYWEGDGWIDLNGERYEALEVKIDMSQYGTYTQNFTCSEHVPEEMKLIDNRIDQLVRNTQQRLNQPLEAAKHTEFGNHHRMASSAKLSRNGLLEISSQTWTDNHFSGFHGAVFVKYLDQYGNTIGRSPWTRYGVDCRYCPAPHRRTDYDDYTVPEALLINTHGIEVVHVTDPNTLNESFQQIDGYTRQFIQGARGLIDTVCDEAPEIDREKCTAYALSKVENEL